MLTTILDLAADAVAAPTADEAAHRFAQTVERAGASYFQARLYPRPGGRLTSASHWQAGGVVLRRAVEGWVGSTGFDFICFEQNPLLTPIRQGRTRYRFSDYASRGHRQYRDYWDAFSRARIAEGLCATAYGADRMIASVHVGLPETDIDPALGEAISIAGSIFVERLMTFATPPPATRSSRLTRREADALSFVAEGKTDWEIGIILGISDKTARFHVDNARRKLGAVSRTHAVALFVSENGLA